MKMKKNKILLPLLIAFGINSAMAQDRAVKNVSLELAGAHTVMGVSLGSCKFGHSSTGKIYTGDRYINMTNLWDENRFAYFIFGNVGYRYQRPSGFVARVGLTPSFNFGGENGFDRPFFYPYVGLGWSF